MAAKLFMDMPGGLKMPALGLGTWQVTNESELENALNSALEVGYRHIDTAFVYQNEALIGRVLKQWFSSGKLKREDLFITTKLPIHGVHQDRVEIFIKKSLANLELDYVDLYLIHFPVGIKPVEGQIGPSLDGFEMEVADHLAIWNVFALVDITVFCMGRFWYLMVALQDQVFYKMEEQIDAGRTKTIGISNFNVRQIEGILKSARIKPACLQVELHVYLQQHDLVQYCQKNGMVVVAYCPLGSPEYNKFVAELGKEQRKLPDMLHDQVIKRIAEKHQKTNAQVMLRYLLQRNIVPIPKSVRPVRLKENIEVFDFSLDAGDMKALNDLEVGEDARVCDFKIFTGLSNHPEWPFPK